MSGTLPTEVAEAFEAYRSARGGELVDLSGFDSDQIPIQDIRAFQSQYFASPDPRYHRRSGLRNLNQFSEGMIRIHSRFVVDKFPHLGSLPSSGIRSAIAAVFARARRENAGVLAFTGTFPGGFESVASRFSVPLTLVTSLDHARDVIDRSSTPIRSIITDSPGVLSRGCATEADWRILAEFARERDLQVNVNAAWSALAGRSHVPFALVAKEYPELRWQEFYSVSRTFSDPGARVGVVIGSRKAVEETTLDIETWESGPSPALIGAYGEFLKDFHRAGKIIDDLAKLYLERRKTFESWITRAGVEMVHTRDVPHFFVAVRPKAGTPYASRLELLRESGILCAERAGPEGETLLVFSLGQDILASKLRRELDARLP